MPQYPVNHDVHAASNGQAITPGTPFAPCRCVLAGTGGAATVTFVDGAAVTVVLIAGYNPISITNVSATALAAANLVALY